MSTGILLLNMGTPADPSPRAVGAYLREFLMDGDVIDLPKPFRWILVNALIVPKRKHASSAKYKSIWTENGSPLLFHSENLRRELQKAMPESPVALAMRYGEPGIRRGIEDLVKRGARKVLLAPLYPQYAEATTGSGQKETQALLREFFPQIRLSVLRPYYDHAAFISAWSSVFRDGADGANFDHVLFSFHGLPERQLRKAHPSGDYREHCAATAHSLAQALGLKEAAWSFSFQSRLGRAKWLGPYTSTRIRELAETGTRSLCVVCPSFTADCLESLEEIGMEGRKNFLAAGGEHFRLIPSLNAAPDWVSGLISILRDSGEI